MRIGIDASRAVAATPTGTETYSLYLIRALLALGERHQYRLYVRARPPSGLFAGADVRVMPFPRLWTHGRLSLEMATRPPDVLFVPAHVLPLVHPRASAVTIHDLGYLHEPALHPPMQRLYLDLSTRWSAHRARRLVADSQATKADLVARYNVPADKITVAYPGVADELRPVTDRVRIEQVTRRYGIEQPYVLYLGTLQPRKNLYRLVEAYARLGRDAPRLVLAGKPGWQADRLVAQVRRLGLERRVILPGYVRAEDKPALLSGAVAFAFPSLYEGFGLPVIEAQACGCPVICSNVSSLPEIAAGSAMLVDPRDVAGLRDALGRLLDSPVLRRELVQRGQANASRFSWQACAERVLEALEQSARH